MIGYLKGVDVAGLQEFQGPQQQAFRAAKTGFAMSAREDNAIVWNDSKFRLVKESSITVPYFEGHQKKMPVVLLEDRATGKQAYFINIHNPADTKNHHHQAGYRAEAVRRERALVEQLKASGLPVFLVGDFNEHGETRTKVTAGGLMQASDAPGGREEIDWVFGAGPVRFGASSANHDPQRAQVSDHPIVTATATI
jgi:endonuclease/exonuclease/phosphatase family metal-dependent hydrolase